MGIVDQTQAKCIIKGTECISNLGVQRVSVFTELCREYCGEEEVLLCFTTAFYSRRITRQPFHDMQISSKDRPVPRRVNVTTLMIPVRAVCVYMCQSGFLMENSSSSLGLLGHVATLTSVGLHHDYHQDYFRQSLLGIIVLC